jgi:hypothetical protein
MIRARSGMRLTPCDGGADPSHSPVHQGSPLEVRDGSFGGDWKPEKLAIIDSIKTCIHQFDLIPRNAKAKRWPEIGEVAACKPLKRFYR